MEYRNKENDDMYRWTDGRRETQRAGAGRRGKNNKWT